MQGWVINLQSISTALTLFIWPFMRISALITSAPFIGSRLVPVRIKIILAILITLAVSHNIEYPQNIDPLSYEAFVTSVNQILIGLMMGFILQLVFNAIALAGENMAMTMGLGFAQMVDPQYGIQVPVVGQFLVICGTLLFLSLNGHITLIQLLALSFEILPVGIDFDSDTIWSLLEWVSNMFIGAVLIALPAVTALLIINFAMGIMTRAAPQLNIFSVGFPVTILIGFSLLAITLPGYLPVLSSLLEDVFRFTRQSIIGL